MIGTIFQFGGEIVEVRIKDSNCMFRTTNYGGAFAPLDALKLDKRGVLKEFPDLEHEEDWREIAIKRFKEKLKKMKTEDKQMEYVIEDLKKWGYLPLYLNKQGFRPKKL